MTGQVFTPGRPDLVEPDAAVATLDICGCLLSTTLAFDDWHLIFQVIQCRIQHILDFSLFTVLKNYHTFVLQFRKGVYYCVIDDTVKADLTDRPTIGSFVFFAHLTQFLITHNNLPLLPDVIVGDMTGQVFTPGRPTHRSS
jgi:hypothetical protein